MHENQRKQYAVRVWPALGGAAIVAAWLAGAAGGMAADAPAKPGPESNTVAVLNDATLWRNSVVAQCFYVRTADGKLESRDFTSFWGGSFGESVPLADCRRIVEDMIMSGHDGLGRYGADLFPVKNAQGKYSYMACGWPRNPRDLMGLALVYPGPDGPVATERYEMFREGVELGEALLFIERAIEEKKLGPALRQRAERHLEDRSNAFVKNWFVTSGMPSPEEDAKLLGLAGEVSRALEREKK